MGSTGLVRLESGVRPEADLPALDTVREAASAGAGVRAALAPHGQLAKAMAADTER